MARGQRARGDVQEVEGGERQAARRARRLALAAGGRGVEAKVMEAMAKGSQALGKEPSTPKIKRLNRVNTVALGMGK